MVAYFPSREGPREAPNTRIKGIIEGADKRKSELSGIIRENMEAILSGKYTEENLIDYPPLNFKSKKAVTAFLEQQFLDRSLRAVAIGIKEIDSDSANVQKANAQETVKTPPQTEPVEIKMDKEALTKIILAEVKSNMSSLALKRKIEGLINTGEIPVEAELCKIYNVKVLRELCEDMIAKWQVRDLNKNKTPKT